MFEVGIIFQESPTHLQSSLRWVLRLAEDENIGEETCN